MLTEAQRKAYLEHSDHCPYCGGDETEVQMAENDYEGTYRQRITCNECGRWWVEVYMLTRIEGSPEGEKNR